MINRNTLIECVYFLNLLCRLLIIRVNKALSVTFLIANSCSGVQNMSCSTSREENATQLSFERLYRCIWYRICPVHLFLLCIELHTIHCSRGRSRHQMLEERRNKPWHYMAGPESIDQLGFKMRSPTSKICNMWGSDSAAWDQITLWYWLQNIQGGKELNLIITPLST